MTATFLLILGTMLVPFGVFAVVEQVTRSRAAAGFMAALVFVAFVAILVIHIAVEATP